MALRLDGTDVSGFKFLLSLAVMYGLMSILVHSVMYTKFITPLGIDAPLDRFSEARAIEHVRVLAHEIDGRQEGRQGLREAAEYIKAQLERLKERAGSNFRIEIEENVVGGSFNMMFLGHGSISKDYMRLKIPNCLFYALKLSNKHLHLCRLNIVKAQMMLILMVHLGAPRCSGLCSCVASLLEIARLTIDSGWVPPRPIIFLFNGAEEVFLLGAHGFMRTHKWRDSIGAFINVEASGTGGLDLVCQSGPGSWPSSVYAQSAIYPMAHSAAQDVFPVIPGDTDYRMFSEDYGSIPGLDIIFLLGGYYYHTNYDTVDRLVPGSMQARGDNLYSAVKAFAESAKLRNARQRESLGVSNGNDDGQAVFFDYLAWFMLNIVKQSVLVCTFLANNITFSLLYNDRISSIDSQETDPSVLMNAHFDGPLGSPGAGDCASCVGNYVPDIVVAAIVGVVTSWCMGPLMPICGKWLARSSILQFLLHLSVIALALSSQFFPYSRDAPKRVVFQHTFLTADANRIVDSSYDFSVVDSNSLLFLFKYAPEVAKELNIGPEFSFETAKMSNQRTFLTLFPVNFLFSRSLQFPARSDEILKQYRQFPHLYTNKPQTMSSDGSRRVYLELSLGSLKEVWVAVLNITGPLSSWSFADTKLPVPETAEGGPPSYICRLTGSSREKWNFWLEGRNVEDIRVDVAVLDQNLVEEAKKLKSVFPGWADVTAYSSFLSTYVF
ncbi:hypothetical protein GOBAR_DD23022 [Gossypium barbadense]|nr:hypothetical protein GOBAR_DD23022 [Gossypium barbadense]